MFYNNPVETFVQLFLWLAVIFGICLVVFLTLRTIMLWYWKVDKVVDLLEQQNELLKAIHKQRQPEKITLQ